MSNIPTRESIASDAFGIVSRQHELQAQDNPITSRHLRTAMNSLIDFYLKPTPIAEKIPYQYKIENQVEYTTNASVISEALDKIYPVISDMNLKMYPLEKHKTPLFLPNQSEPINIPTPNVEKKSIFPSLRKPQPEKANPDDPYQSIIVLRKNTMKIIDNWDLVTRWQSGGTEMDEDFTRVAYDKYLSTHRSIFRDEIVPNLLRVYSQGINIVLMKEKELASSYGNNMMKEMFQTRNDMPQQS